MTSDEKDIVKHHVNCGRLKNRLALFLHGMESIERKVHPVNSIKLIPLSVCMNVHSEVLQASPQMSKKMSLHFVS